MVLLRQPATGPGKRESQNCKEMSAAGGQIRQQALARRNKLRSRGSERLELLQPGHSVNREFEGSDCGSPRSNDNSNPDSRGGPGKPDLVDLLSSSAIDDFNLLPKPPGIVQCPPTQMAAAATTATGGASSPRSTSSASSLADIAARTRSVAKIKIPFLFSIGLIAVLVSAALAKLNHPKPEAYLSLDESRPSPSYNYFFYKLNSVCTIIFCCSEIIIQIFLVRSWHIVLSPSLVFNLGLLLPVLQLIVQILTVRQFIMLLITGLTVASAFLRQRLMQRIGEACFNNALEFIHSFAAAKMYFTDYAVYCVANAGAVLLVSFFNRYWISGTV